MEESILVHKKTPNPPTGGVRDKHTAQDFTFTQNTHEHNFTPGSQTGDPGSVRQGYSFGKTMTPETHPMMCMWKPDCRWRCWLQLIHISLLRTV